jgi:hypothetical protein
MRGVQIASGPRPQRTRRRRGDLLAALRQLDEEEDVNKVLRYFSYEHFYVIYCKARRAPGSRAGHQAALGSQGLFR